MKDKTDKYQKKIEQLESELSGFRSAIEELKILNEIAVAVGKAANIDETLNIIVQKIVRYIGAEQGLIYLVTPQKDVFKTFIKQDDTSTLKHSYRISTTITGWVLINEKSLLIEDVRKDERFNLTDEEKREIQSVLCSPIWFEGKIIGIILMINKRSKKSFSENELTLLSIIAVQAGQIIKNSQMQREAMIKMKEAEIAELKSRFFTNIAHEFRTPLTLILGPADKLLTKLPVDDTIKQAEFIKRNAARLLGLTNQLLDLSKLEAGKLKLEATYSNIVSFIKGVTQSFESLAEQKDIKLKVIAEKESIEVYFDKDKMMIILSNLLSNALKFTPEDGSIEISIKETKKLPNAGFIEITVRDTGIGIPEADIPKLFERFYQVENRQSSTAGGTGIGLALTKELIDLHHWSIRVNSRLGEGSEFIIELPPGKERLGENEIVVEGKSESDNILYEFKNLAKINTPASSLQDVHQDIEMRDNLNIILVVEDNADVREYIKDSLSDEFMIEEASNGEQGVRKAEKIIPDLIISDMLMPKMAGNELVKILKSDEKTSHIPIILLTAQSEQENKLDALDSGADDYLTKPFDTQELKIRIKNLINIRKTLQQKFSSKDFHPIKRGEEKKLSDPEEKFVNKLNEVIEKHLSEEEFSIEQFGREVGMSRVQLHRKLKALFGKSASIYLRSFRLIRAKKMIEEQKGNISEIAYSVGFSSPEYFTRCFKKEFSITPSDLIS